MSTKSLIKPIGINTAGISTSRLLGFLRDILLAAFFGTGRLIQAFIVAFRIPNFLRQLVGEGAASGAFVPVLSEYLATKKKNEFWRLANIILFSLLAALAIIVVMGVIAAPLIVRIIAPGFTKDKAQLVLAISLTRIMFPYIFLIGLAALASGILNSLKHFTAPAFTSSLLNISIITAILLCYRNINVYILAAAVLVGGVLQLAFQIPVLYKKGMRLALPKSFHHPAAKKIKQLLIPRAFGSAVHQLNSIVDTILASLEWIVGTGAIAALWYSYRLVQFPTAIFGHAVAIAALPTLSGYFARGKTADFKKTVGFSLKSVFLFMIPAGAAFMIIGNPIIRTLFQRGEFGSYSVLITNKALFFYCVGLFSYAGIRILAFSFYSMQDTRTPVKTAAIALVINIVFNLILMGPLKIGGLALATSIAGIFNFFALFYILRKKIGPLDEKDLLAFLVKIIIASLFMGVVLFWIVSIPALMSIFNSGVIVMKISALLLLIISGLVSYVFALLVLRVREIGNLLKWIKPS